MTETLDKRPKNDWPFWRNLLELGRKLDEQEQIQKKQGRMVPLERTHRIRLWNAYLGKRLSKLPEEQRKQCTDAHGKPFVFPDWRHVSDTEKERIAELEKRYKPRPVSQGMGFAGQVFDSDIDFSGLVFWNANFSGATFLKLAGFQGATFSKWADFSDAEFSGEAYFRGATFSGQADFNNAQFKAGSNFNKVEFLKEPPLFFEARLHEDTRFLDTKFPPPPKDREEADTHVRAWQRLARIMNEQERPAERHRFYRLEMQAQRVVDGKKSWAYWSNRLYEMICDFGYGIGRAFAWWVGHMFFFAGLMLAFLTDNIACLTSKTFWSALAVSASNAHPFFGLQKTWNGNAYADIITMAELQGVLPVLQIIGNAQAFLGPIFLFLLLLTFRNRFRIG